MFSGTGEVQLCPPALERLLESGGPLLHLDRWQGWKGGFLCLLGPSLEEVVTRKIKIIWGQALFFKP